ncbi:hypothetical protein D9758_002484 [Tetrapyrgos nigripes]|uniref:DUF6532 domain-containing protein n=1 Tax=Tetrapyrgos nigripes TaxID=182062 RepID=A0A8H5LTL7_9AGAR|nr:hypothetical protein D9758_002484 [Tetrapyrgos nigripes]
MTGQTSASRKNNKLITNAGKRVMQDAIDQGNFNPTIQQKREMLTGIRALPGCEKYKIANLEQWFRVRRANHEKANQANDLEGQANLPPYPSTAPKNMHRALETLYQTHPSPSREMIFAWATLTGARLEDIEKWVKDRQAALSQQPQQPQDAKNVATYASESNAPSPAIQSFLKSQVVSPVIHSAPASAPNHSFHLSAMSPSEANHSGEDEADTEFTDDEVHPQPLSSREAMKANGARQHPKGSSYESKEKMLIAKAIELYRIKVTSEDAFPNSLLRSKWARMVWEQACQEYDTDIEADDSMIKLIMAQDTHLRGETKTAAKTLVDIAYGFETSRKDSIIKENRDLAYQLKSSLAFTYRRPEERKGLYQHRIILKIVNMVWFKNITDEGVRYTEYNPFPLHGLALVLTAVECAIDEWILGKLLKREFTADSYRMVYEGHVQSLITFREKSSHQNILGKILEVLTDNALTNAGAAELENFRHGEVPEDVFDEEIRQFEL